MRDAILTILKREGPLTAQAIGARARLSATTVRHHVARLRADGLIRTRRADGLGIGRPAYCYEVTAAADGRFPKRYAELLHAVLREARAIGMLDALLERVVMQMSVPLSDALRAAAPGERMATLLAALDYGDMVATLETDAGVSTLRASNCLYRDTGEQFAQVCNIVPRVIGAGGYFEAERLECQRDGARTCNFTLRMCAGQATGSAHR